MKRLLRMIVMILPVVAFAAPRMRAVRGEPDLSRILWVGAHPDDETFIAPLLGRQCVESTSDCTLLVMTEGEKGGSATIRVQEMQAAAALLHAHLIQWTLPDVIDDVWPHDQVVRQIADVIASTRPTVIITFDPNHGSSCHPAHRFTGSLVLQAAKTTPVYFVETFNDDFVLRDAVTFANKLITFEASSTWHYLVTNMRTHASQFSPAQVEEVEATEPKRVYLMPSTSSAQYNVTCP